MQATQQRNWLLANRNTKNSKLLIKRGKFQIQRTLKKFDVIWERHTNQYNIEWRWMELVLNTNSTVRPNPDTNTSTQYRWLQSECYKEQQLFHFKCIALSMQPSSSINSGHFCLYWHFFLRFIVYNSPFVLIWVTNFWNSFTYIYWPPACLRHQVFVFVCVWGLGGAHTK